MVGDQPCAQALFPCNSGVIDTVQTRSLLRTFSNQEKYRWKATIIFLRGPEIVAPGVADFVRRLRGIA